MSTSTDFSEFGALDQPRIRHISSIRIHKLDPTSSTRSIRTTEPESSQRRPRRQRTQSKDRERHPSDDPSVDAQRQRERRYGHELLSSPSPSDVAGHLSASPVEVSHLGDFPVDHSNPQPHSQSHTDNRDRSSSISSVRSHSHLHSGIRSYLQPHSNEILHHAVQHVASIGTQFGQQHHHQQYQHHHRRERRDRTSTMSTLRSARDEADGISGLGRGHGRGHGHGEVVGERLMRCFVTMTVLAGCSGSHLGEMGGGGRGDGRGGKADDDDEGEDGGLDHQPRGPSRSTLGRNKGKERQRDVDVGESITGFRLDPPGLVLKEDREDKIRSPAKTNGLVRRGSTKANTNPNGIGNGNGHGNISSTSSTSTPRRAPLTRNRSSLSKTMTTTTNAPRPSGTSCSVSSLSAKSQKTPRSTSPVPATTTTLTSPVTSPSPPISGPGSPSMAGVKGSAEAEFKRALGADGGGDGFSELGGETEIGMNGLARRRSTGSRILGKSVVGRVTDGEPKEKELVKLPLTEGTSTARIPFYISPIHTPSTHPTFSGLNVHSDFAEWVTTDELAGHRLRIEYWVERRWQSGPTTSPGPDAASGQPAWTLLRREDVDLRELRDVPSMTEELPPNTMIFTLHNHGDRRYYFPLGSLADCIIASETTAEVDGSAKPAKSAVHSILQRSMRETRMQKGASLSRMHAIVDLQSNAHETRQQLEAVQIQLSRLIARLSDLDALTRSVGQKSLEASTLRAEIGRSRDRAASVRATIAERRRGIAARRAELRAAEPHKHRYAAAHEEIAVEIMSLRTTKAQTLRSVFRHRARCTSLLDTVFPIFPLDPPKLLYTILSVPLPIPQTHSDTAPPLTMSSSKLPSGIRVDEDSTATALGFVAQVLTHLSVTMDKPLLYPVTCAGSRSLVKDHISVIQGGRSFPLYARGVEKYRYEYAVFLLNKDIETLMVEGNIKIEDMRHTLPNLKTLLLVLASQAGPAPVKTVPTRSVARPSAAFRFPSGMTMTST